MIHVERWLGTAGIPKLEDGWYSAAGETILATQTMGCMILLDYLLPILSLSMVPFEHHFSNDRWIEGTLGKSSNPVLTQLLCFWFVQTPPLNTSAEDVRFLRQMLWTHKQVLPGCTLLLRWDPIMLPWCLCIVDFQNTYNMTADLCYVMKSINQPCWHRVGPGGLLTDGYCSGPQESTDRLYACQRCSLREPTFKGSSGCIFSKAR